MCLFSLKEFSKNRIIGVNLSPAYNERPYREAYPVFAFHREAVLPGPSGRIWEEAVERGLSSPYPGLRRLNRAPYIS